MSRPNLPDDLAASVAEGIITEDQARAVAAKRAETVAAEEPVSLVSNFSDVFLTLGLVLVWLASGRIAALGLLPPVATYTAFAAGFWLLAEFLAFRAQKRFGATVAVVLMILMAVEALSYIFGPPRWTEFAIGAFNGLPGLVRATLPHFGLVAGLLALAFARFRLPGLMLGLGLCALFGAMIALRALVPGLDTLWMLLVLGLAFVLWGVALDRMDMARTGTAHEAALWLFVIGSPLVVHSTMVLTARSFIERKAGDLREAQPQTLDEGMAVLEGWQAIVMENFSSLAVMAGALSTLFIVLGLLFDRRSLVASTLIYLTVVFTYGVFSSGGGLTLAFAVAPLAVGIGVLVLGLGWGPLRRALLKLTPSGMFRPA